MSNPFSKADFNLTEQMKIEKQNPGLANKLREEAAALDRDAERRKNTQTVAEFNKLDKDEKIRFIQNGGTVA